MNKKEIAEIKKQFTPANCTIRVAILSEYMRKN